MTNSGDDAGRIESSGSTAGGSEPPQTGFEAPPIDQSPTPPDGTDQTPPTGYAPLDPGYAAGPYSPPGYPPPPAGYPQPFPGPDPGYGASAYPPPQYGTYPPPPTGYPGAEYGYGGPAPQGTNTLAIASLVASIVGVCCGLGSIVGIVLGIVALNQIKQTRQSGHGLAVGGIVVGVVTLLISMAWTIAAIAS